MATRRRTVALAGLLIAAAFAVPGSAQAPCDAHPPIEITEEEGLDGFALATLPTGHTLHRPGSGVTSGSGTAEDPYVIEGWCIEPVNEQGEVGIRIADTDSHVVIADNTVGEDFATGVAIDGAQHVALEGNEVVGNDDGVLVTDAREVRVSGNELVTNGAGFGGNGLTIQGTDEVDVLANRIADNAENGIGLAFAQQVTIEGNEITGHSFDAIDVDEAAQVAIRGNELTGNDFDGIYVDDTVGLSIADNTISDNYEGIGLRESSQISIEHNTVSDNELEAVDAFRVSDVSLEANVLTGNREGVDVNDGSGLQLVANNVHQNTVGLDLLDVEGPVDAGGNWWGAVSGPGGGVEDACTDAVADGDGDPIDADAAPVCFAGWLTEPNPDAGADT